MAEQRVWELGTATRRTVAMGRTAGQWIVVVAACTVGLGGAWSSAWFGVPTGVQAGWAFLWIGGGLAYYWLHLDWTPTARAHTTHLLRKGAGTDTWTAAGQPAHPADPQGFVLPRIAQRPHRAARRLRIVEHGATGGLVDLQARRVTACVDVSPPSSMVASADQLEVVWAGWSDLLEQVARQADTDGIVRVGWVTQVAPTPPSEVTLEAGGLPALAAWDVEQATVRTALAHRTLLWLSVAPEKARRKPAGSSWRQAGTLRAGRLLEVLCGPLSDAGWQVGAPLDGVGLSAAVRRTFEPSFATTCDAASAWPQHVTSRPDRYHADGWAHRVWHCERLPQRAAGHVTSRLTGACDVPHSVAACFEPVPVSKLARQAASEVVDAEADLADAGQKSRHVTPQERKRLDDARRLEDEVAAGAAAYRMSLWVAVSAEGVETLEVETDRMVQQAATAQVGLRQAWGAHDQAHLALLPSGRGVGRMR